MIFVVTQQYCVRVVFKEIQAAPFSALSFDLFENLFLKKVLFILYYDSVHDGTILVIDCVH